jgi:hypothetical protein
MDAYTIACARVTNYKSCSIKTSIIYLFFGENFRRIYVSKNICEHACGGNSRGGENVFEKCVPKVVPTKRQKYREVQDEEN